MTSAACAVYEIRFLQEVRPGPGGTVITFQGGAGAIVPGDHPDYELLCSEAEESLQRRLPVGIILDAEGRILDLSHTHESLVRGFHEDEDGKRLAIGFWAFCAVCYLTHDHPDFERIFRTLTESVATASPVVFANETWPVEGETEIWQKILDVRPAPVPRPAQEANGTAAVAPRGGIPQVAGKPGAPLGE